MMKIVITDKDGNTITDLRLETNPFKVGESVNIDIKNYDTDLWSIKPVYGNFVVDKISHDIRKDYQINNNCYENFTVLVEVSQKIHL